MKSLCGSIVLPFAIALIGGCPQGYAQQTGTGSGAPATPVPTFQPPAVVVPGISGQQPAIQTDGDDKKRDKTVGGESPFATPDDDYVPDQAPVTPRMRHEQVDSNGLYVVHLRPLFTTGIKLPDDVVAIAVGAPSLIWAEHNKDVPRLIFVKPLTNAPVNSDIIVSLKSGATITIHAFSSGEKGSDDPVDFLVDYGGDSSLMRDQAEGSSLFRNRAGELTDPQVEYQSDGPVPELSTTPAMAGGDAETELSGIAQNGVAGLRSPPYRQTAIGGAHYDPGNVAAVGNVRTSEGKRVFTVSGTLLESMYQEQVSLATPRFMDGVELSHVYPADKNATTDLAVSIGRMVQQGDTMTFSYSVENRSGMTIEIMPPHREFSDPKPRKPSKKRPTAIAEQLTVDDYILTATKLAPGQRVDGAIQFERPPFKYRKQLLMLQVASASEVDTALLLPIPFTTQFGSN